MQAAVSHERNYAAISSGSADSEYVAAVAAEAGKDSKARTASPASDMMILAQLRVGDAMDASHVTIGSLWRHNKANASKIRGLSSQMDAMSANHQQLAAAVAAVRVDAFHAQSQRCCVPHRDVPPVFMEDLHGDAAHDIVAQLTMTERRVPRTIAAVRGAAVGVSVAASADITVPVGGVGKTLLALQAFRHAAVVALFGHRRYWLTLGEKPDVLSLVNKLLGDLATDLTAAGVSIGHAATSVSTMDGACEALDCLLRLMTTGGGRVLLVLDDVWKADHARPFLLHLHATLGDDWRREPGVSYLLTSRRSALLSRQLGATVRELAALSMEASLALFWRCCDVGITDPVRVTHDAAARRICERRCGQAPLALQMMGSIVRNRLAIGNRLLETLRALEEDVPPSVAIAREDVDDSTLAGAGDAQQTAADPRAHWQYGSMRECVLLSLWTVEESLRRRYLQLAVLDKRVVISSDVLAVLWGVSTAVAMTDCRILLDRHLLLLAERSHDGGDAGDDDRDSGACASAASGKAGPAGGTYGGGRGTAVSAAGTVHVMLHDLQRGVLLREAGDGGMSAMHGLLLWRLASICCGVPDGPSRLWKGTK
jgi:hypothetical protein